jgi:thioredoxin-related protein
MKWTWILLVAVGLNSYGQEPPAWFAETLLDLREDVAEAAKERKRMMVYFGQDGCPYCKRLMEVNFADPAIVAKTRRHFTALALNIWGDREVTWTDGRTLSEKQLAAALKVQFTPTLIFLDEKGGVAFRLNGYLPPDRFLAALDSALGKVAPPPPISVKPGAKPTAVLVCGACEELDRDFLKRPEVRSGLAKFVFEKRTAAAGAQPSLILFDKAGQEVFRTEAYLRPFHIAGALDYVASGAYLREPSFQRFLQDRSERMKKQGVDVDLWK